MFQIRVDADKKGIAGTGNLTKAVETLAELLGNNDKRLKRFAAKDVIEFFLRHRELAELEKRIGLIEERLQSRT